jgi:predicted nucleic acid-binding protein
MVEQLVLDNSVVMSWCFRDEANPYADAILDRLSTATALVPSVWPLEVVNVLLVAERRNRISTAAGVRFLSLLTQLPIIVEYEPAERMMKDLLNLARANRLSSYDASYLALAMQKGIPLATLDHKLITAAKNVDVKILAC